MTLSTWFVMISMVLNMTHAAANTKPIPVKVGYGEFPPIFVNTDQGPSGFWVDLVILINTSQSDYHFVFEPITPKRRTTVLEKKQVDIIANESPGFDWDEKLVNFTIPIYSITDHFVALKEVAKNQAYFSDLRKKRIRCMLGYHYNFEKEYQKTNRPLLIETTSNHYGNLQAVLDRRTEIAVVSDIYLPTFFHDHPEAKEKLLISSKVDGRYKMAFVVPKNDPKVDFKKLNSYLLKFKENGELQKLRSQYHLQKP